MPHVQVLIVSSTDPRTKPKALNCALPFARGSFTAVFDAEDRPDPGQLRAALDAFRGHDTDVACAQASLCIHNNKDSWLSRGIMAQTPQAPCPQFS
jgi:cellulose synthase/poly-beta-1,6-N-acetylglucosamine synthase-like glycosyltransferase